MRIKKAVIPAAGLGTRFLPATKAMPKEMLPVIDKPAIQYVVEEAACSGIRKVLIITGEGKRAIREHFRTANKRVIRLLEKRGKAEVINDLNGLNKIADIRYAKQSFPRGLGHAISCAKKFVGNEPFAVLLGDDIVVDSEMPCILQLAKEFERMNKPIIAVTAVPFSDVSKYGIVTVEGEGRVKRIKNLIEKPKHNEAPSNLAVIGRYIFTPDIFDYLKRTKPGLDGEIQLADALSMMISDKKEIYAYEFSGKRYDLGDKADYINATLRLALKRPELREKVIATIRSISEELG
ncbi:MAG: UTP--glucose-1-phosphate uridylyltransferase GalU [Candidatus Anstonellales archaeon]